MAVRLWTVKGIWFTVQGVKGRFRVTADIQQDNAAAAGPKFGPFGYILESCQSIGATILRLFHATGALFTFILQSVMHCFTPPFFPRLILRQFIDMGYYSLPVVGMTALFTGMVLALQSYTGFSRFNAESAIASVVQRNSETFYKRAII